MAKLQFLLLFLSFSAAAQFQEEFFISNFNEKDYQASVSNWDISLSEEGVVFVANLEGPLIFNGSFWNYLPANSAALSLSISSEGQAYFGFNNQLSFLEVTPQGLVALSVIARSDGNIWPILECGKAIYFLSKTQLFTWSEDSLQITTAGEDFIIPYPVCIDGNLLYLRESGNLVSTGSTTNNSKIKSQMGAVPPLIYAEHNTLTRVLSRNGSMREYKANTLIRDERLKVEGKSLELFRGKEFINSAHYAFATLTDGIYITDDHFSAIVNINVDHGLASNMVKSVYMTNDYNIWAATQNGISYIEYGSPFRQIKFKKNINEIISAIGKHQNNLLIGTQEGLTALHEGQMLLGDARVWDIKMLNGQLLVASNQGLFEIGNNQHKVEGAYTTVAGLNENFIAFESAGVQVLNKELKVEQEIPLQGNTFVDAEALDSTQMLATAKFKGVYHIANMMSSAPKATLYTAANGLPQSAEMHLIKYKNEVLITTSEGLYQFKYDNPDSMKFVPYKGNLNPRGHIVHAEVDPQGNYYFSIKQGRTDRVEIYQLQQDGSFKRVYKPFKRLPEMEITAIYPDEDSILWIAGNDGLFKYDGKIHKEYELDYNTVVNRVMVGDSLLFGGFYPREVAGSKVPGITIRQPEGYKYDLPYNHNSLTFEYAATFYELPEKTEYSYLLENYDDDWSKWSVNNKKEYTNLDPGTYIFKVKAKNIYDHEGRVATYEFTILAPWYRTVWAYLGFAILLLFLIWIFVLLYTYRIRQQRRNLKLLVADRTYEVLNQKKEIESQNKQLKYQFEEITRQKDEIQLKNDELQQSQEEVLAINNQLEELNVNLEKKVAQRTKHVKATLVKLKKANKELDTFIYRASHDLKGPISRIHGLTSLGKLEAPDETSKNYYNLIEHTALSMQNLLSKLSHAYEIMNREVIPEAIDLPSLLIGEKDKLKFLETDAKYSFDLTKAPTFFADKYLFGMIVRNLMENALLFKKIRGEHTINVRCFKEEHMLVLIISDNGIGISEDHLPNVFDMFYRASDLSKGSGLGLYNVKRATEKLHGSIIVDSILYEGTTVTVKIPIVTP